MIRILLVLLCIAMPSLARAQCSSVRDLDQRSMCRAYESGSTSYCGQIRDLDRRAYCKAVLTVNTSYCSQIRAYDYRQSCQGSVQFKKTVREIKARGGELTEANASQRCSRIYVARFRYMCKAITEQQSTYCGMISGDNDLRNYCHAAVNVNMSYCGQIRDYGTRARCRRSIRDKMFGRGAGILGEQKPDENIGGAGTTAQ